MKVSRQGTSEGLDQDGLVSEKEGCGAQLRWNEGASTSADPGVGVDSLAEIRREIGHLYSYGRGLIIRDCAAAFDVTRRFEMNAIGFLAGSV